MRNLLLRRLAAATITLLMASTLSLPAKATGGNGTCETGNFGGGTGATEANAYQIHNLNAWLELGDCMRSTSNWSSGKFFRLTSDIDLGGVSRRPVGAYSDGVTREFGGELDGGNFRIFNLNAATSGGRSSDSLIGRGLFWYVVGGKIKNLTVEGTLTAARYEISGGLTVAASSSVFSRVITRISIQCASGFTSTNREIGGLIGRVITLGSLSILESHVLPADSNPGINCPGVGGGTSSGTDNNSLFLGGLVGGTWNTSVVTISSSSARIPISARALDASIGGLVGGQPSSGVSTGEGGKLTVRNSFYEGEVTLSGGSTYWPGGFAFGGAVGYAAQKQLDIAGFYSAGSLNLGPSKNFHVGGVVGTLANRSSSFKSKIENSYSSLDMNFETSGTASEGSIGGIVGEHKSGTTARTWSTGSLLQASGAALTNQGAVIGKLVAQEDNIYNYFDAESFPTLGAHSGQAPLEDANRTSNYKKIYLSERPILSTYSTNGSSPFSMQTYSATPTRVWSLCEEPFLSWQGLPDQCLPRLVSASVSSLSPSVVRLQFSKDLNPAQSSLQVSPSAFSISNITTGQQFNPTSLARGTGSSSSVELNFSAPFIQGEVLRLSYFDFSDADDPDSIVLEDEAGIDVQTFLNANINNQSEETRPTLSQPRITSFSTMPAPGRTSLALIAPNGACPTNSDNVVAPDVLEVLVDGASVGLSQSMSCSVVLGDAFVSIELLETVYRDQVITVQYLGPSAGVTAAGALVDSQGIAFGPTSAMVISDNAYAAWRPKFQTATLGPDFDELILTFETYNQGIQFGNTVSTSPALESPRLHPVWEYLSLSSGYGIDTPTIQGSTLRIPLGRVVYRNEVIQGSYTDPQPTVNDSLTGVIELKYGSSLNMFDAPNFTFTVDTSNAPVRPTAQSANVAASGRELVVVFSEDISPTMSPVSLFAVTVSGQAVQVVSLSRSVSTNNLILSLESGFVILSGQSVSVSYADPNEVLENVPEDALGSANGDWDVASFTIAATNNSARVAPVVIGSLTSSETTVQATATCQSACGMPQVFDAVYLLLQGGNQVAQNSTGTFTGLTASTSYTVEISVVHEDVRSATWSGTVVTAEVVVASPAPAPAPAPEPEPAPAPTSTPTPTPSPTLSPDPTSSPAVSESPTISPEASPTPTPTPTPTAEPSPGPTPSANPLPSPSPSPRPVVTAAPSPTPRPTVIIATAEPEPSPEPEQEGQGEPAPSPSPTETTTAAEPTQTPSPGPTAAVVTVEQIESGVISLDPGQDELVLPALLVQEIVVKLAPGPEVDLSGGVFRVDTSIRTFTIPILELGEIRLLATEIGDRITFTLDVPGFEAKSLQIEVKKSELISWVFGLAVVPFVAAFWIWFLLAKRRKKNANFGQQIKN